TGPFSMGGVSGMFSRLGRLVTARPWSVCLVWVAAGIFLSAVAPPWDSRAQDDDLHFLPDRCPCVRGYKVLEQAFPQDVFASRALVTVERDDRPLGEPDFALVDRLVQDLEELRRSDTGLPL